MPARCRRLAALVAGLFVVTVHAGPPFLTDDPEPVERGHAEIDLIAQATRTGAGRSGSVQAELNLGCAHETQCHVALPMATDQPIGGPTQTGLGDAEVGAKLRFLDRPDDGWSAAVYPTLFLPTGDARRGLGNGRAQLLLPLWVQRSVGAWNLDGGTSLLVNPAPAARNSWYTGLLAQRSFGDRLSVGAEVFHRGSPAAGVRASSGFNVGAIVNVASRQNLLLSLGRGLTNVDANRGSIFLAYQLEQ